MLPGIEARHPTLAGAAVLWPLTAAIIASALAGASFSIDAELPAETVCWILVVASRRLVPQIWHGVRPDASPSPAPPTRHPAAWYIPAARRLAASSATNFSSRRWLLTAEARVAGALLSATLCRSATDTGWIAPVVMPILIALCTVVSHDRGGGDPETRRLRGRILYLQAVVGVACLWLLRSAGRLAILDLPAAAVQGAALAVAFRSLNLAAGAGAGTGVGAGADPEKTTEPESGGRGFRGVGDGEPIAVSVAWKLAEWHSGALVAALLLGLDVRGRWHHVAWIGFWKAVRWVALVRLTQSTPWVASISIDLATLSWRCGLAVAPNVVEMGLTACFGLVALLQLHSALPAPVRWDNRTTNLLRICGLVCLLAPLWGLRNKGDIEIPADAGHPAELLYENARASHEALLAAQSETLEQAVADYDRRYGRHPPAGFDAWFRYAKSKNSLIIDDFDLVDESLRPFRRYHPTEINNTLGPMARSNLNVLLCGFAGGSLTGDCGQFGHRIAGLLADVGAGLPDVTFALNLLDEPSVMPVVDPDFRHMDADVWTLVRGKPTWPHLSPACAGREPFRPRFPAPSVDTLGVPFVTDVMSAKDACRQHSEGNETHGFLAGPATLAYTRWPFPLLSRASTSPFSDVPFPSPHYAREGEAYDAAGDDDVAFEDKIVGLYWAGKATGMKVSRSNWHRGHRQRLVRLADNPPYTYLTGGGGGGGGGSTAWKPFRSPRLDSWLIHTHVSDLVQCSWAACLAEARALRPRNRPLPQDGPAAPYRYTLALDIDGNSYSGRFYRLLASGSATLKATLFREWHDDRLVPWFHYVPVSVSLDELPELVRFLTRTARGRDLARRIARNGREAHATALRPADMAVYMYRLLLELAWLVDRARSLETDG